jgi:hypothetical protein
LGQGRGLKGEGLKELFINQSILSGHRWLKAFVFEGLELDSGFRRSDEHGMARLFVGIPAKAGIQDYDKIEFLSTLLWPY